MQFQRSSPFKVLAILTLWGTCAYAGVPARAPGTTLVSLEPQPGTKSACIDTPLRLAFSAPPTLAKTGTLQLVDDSGNTIDTIDLGAPAVTKTIGGLANFNYHPVVVTGNEAVISFKNSLLAYDKTYTVAIPSGTFLDREGKPITLGGAEHWTFTTKAAAPVMPDKGPRKVTVAADGSGDFATVQGALDFIPANNTTPTTLFIRKGTYPEIVYVANKNNLTIVGEDRKATVIAITDNQTLNNTDTNRMPGGYRRGMFRAVNCNDLTIANLTLHNTTPKGGGQAEAIILNGGKDAHAILTGLDLASFQDTLQINGQAFVSDCYIEGDVDFMWGTGPVFFEKCECKAVNKNAYYTQIRNTAGNHGYVYHNCLFDGADGVTNCLLSRIDPARFPASEVVLIDCTLTGAVGDAGWRFDGRGGATADLHFWECNSHDPAGNPIDDSMRFAASKRLSKDSDADVIKNYSNPAWVLGGWMPKVPLSP